MSGLPGSRHPVSGISPRVPHILTTVHLVTPPLLQHALPPAGVQLRHRFPLQTERVPRVIADSKQRRVRCCSCPSPSDVPPPWPDLYSLPTTMQRSHTSGQLLQIRWLGLSLQRL